MRIIAVVVTYNRRELLKRNIHSLRQQDSPLSAIVVVNNGSTDGTAEWLAEQHDLKVISQENVGGSGGFYTGIREAYDMGADSFKVFMTVTLPLIKDSFLSGLVTAFVRSITAISAIILLVTPQFLLITVQINEFAEKGSYSLACAFATILIIITYGAVVLMNLFIKHFGTSRKIKEDN